MARIKYTCNNCGWNRSVPSQWADIKPKRCMNAKCNTSFVKDPKSLVIDDPTRKTKSVKSEVKFEGKPNKPESKVEVKEEDESSNKNANSKSKRSRKTKQQQNKKEEKTSS